MIGLHEIMVIVILSVSLYVVTKIMVRKVK